MVYGLLLVIWGVVVAWQIAEHDRVRDTERTLLINRSRDITTTLGLVIRSQRRFGSIVSQERLESALSELVKAGELSSVALLNATGEVVVSAGPPIDLDPKGTARHGQRWEHRSVTIVNPIDLGTTITHEGETNRPIIVLPRRDSSPTTTTTTSSLSSSSSSSLGPHDGDRSRIRLTGLTNDPGASNGPSLARDLANAPWGEPGGGWPGFSNGPPGTNAWRRGGPRTGRPPWMNEKEYQSLLESRGLHGLVIAMSTEGFRNACDRDLWMRCLIACFAGVSAVGLGLAWRNLAKSSELQMRLLRAGELNSHLREMNLAAAGLAHETRNPLNIVRGLAQLISMQEDASPAIRKKSREIIDETDRVTGQLNEFINYSKPREVRRSPVQLASTIAEVVRALSFDLEEKRIVLTVAAERLTIEADEQQLRQVLFNLLLNAIQAVEPGSAIQIGAGLKNVEAWMEVRDNGPGVPPEHRDDIFKPYFTTHQKGTGLGLAIVQQIVLVHGWEIECLPNEPRGAIFRISHLKPLASL